MGSCISAPKDSEKTHHAKGKPTTNQVVAVSLYSMTWELAFLKRAVSSLLCMAVYIGPVSHC